MTGPSGHAEGQWRGTALVRNLKTAKSNTISVDIVAREPSKLRMEIGGPFGVHVASLTLNGPEVRVILTQQKKFISGGAEGSTLSRVIPVKIPPTTLMAILFERPLSEKEWACDDYLFTKLPVECSHRSEKLKIKWIEREGLARRLKIAAPDGEIELVLKEAKTKTPPADETFVIEPPVGFRMTKG